MSYCPPEKNCLMCPRLVRFREENKQKFPAYHNGPVEPFGRLDARLLVVGMAPGLNGANQTNRPFTNDYAGDVLYPALQQHGLAAGNYQKRKDDGFELIDARVTNAVRCVPPQNKPTGDETKTCAAFLATEIAAMPNLKVILSLGTVSHNAVLRVLGYRQSEFKFVHGAIHHLPHHPFVLADSYHTSRYNINTGVLTYEMFDTVIQKVHEMLQK